MQEPPTYLGWTKGDGDSLVQLTAITGSPGSLWPYPISALPVSVAQNMPSLQQAFITGYLAPQLAQGGVTAIGELVVTRAHDVPESGKAYVYLVGIDEAQIPYFVGPFKPWDGHYFDQAFGVPIGNLVGKIDLSNLSKRNV